MIKTTKVEKRGRCGRQDPVLCGQEEDGGLFPGSVLQQAHDPKEETLSGVPQPIVRFEANPKSLRIQVDLKLLLPGTICSIQTLTKVGARA